LKALSGKAFCRLLERHGWALQRIESSHHIYAKPGHRLKPSVPVHGNKTLKIGMQRSLMRQAGLTEDDL
jgi:predicted RNA binding protein YcfA (HicA-like mRNA interferase family)